MFRRDSKGVGVARKGFKWEEPEGWVDGEGEPTFHMRQKAGKVLGVGTWMAVLCPLWEPTGMEWGK